LSSVESIFGGVEWVFGWF